MNIVVASHNEEILQKYFMKSKLPDDVTLTTMKNYKNVAKAYNDALKITDKDDIVIFVHHDVILRDGWFDRLKEIISHIDEDWGVIGVAGASYVNGKLVYKGNIINDGVEWKHGETGNGAEFEEVQTIDELLFITKNTNFIFDEKLGNHFYCADLCLYSQLNGKKNYVINNPCEHSGGENKVKDDNGEFVYSDDFYRARTEIGLKYPFPFATTCTIINQQYA